jgi:hypothetical protein
MALGIIGPLSHSRRYNGVAKGNHIPNIQDCLQQADNNVQLVYMANTVYLAVAVSVKISLLLFIMPVFLTGYVKNRYWGIITFIALFTITGVCYDVLMSPSAGNLG